jgi:type IV pilus assembly protein PilE
MHARLSRLVPPRGFTLVELMVAMAAVAILVAVALPTFFEQVARARRSDMQAALMEDAAYLQHYESSHDAFMDTPPPQLPAPRAPRSGAANYVILLSVPADNPGTYVLTAQRTGAMGADPCGDFTYDWLGRRDLVAGTFAAGRSALSCWR